LYKGNTTIAPLDLSDNEYYKFLKEFCVYVDYELSKKGPCEN